MATQDGRFLFVSSGRTDTSEMRVIDMKVASDQPLKEPVKPLLKLISARRPGHRYRCTARGDTLYLVSNRNGRREGSIFMAPLQAVLAERGEAAWVELMPYDRKVQVTGIVARKHFAVVRGREGGFPRSWIMHAKALDEAEEACRMVVQADQDIDNDAAGSATSAASTSSAGGDRHVPASSVEGIEELPGPDRPVLEAAPPLVQLPAGSGEAASCVYASPLERDNDSPLLRVSADSMLSPACTFQFDITSCPHVEVGCSPRPLILQTDAGAYLLLKRRDIPNTEPSKYRSTVVHARVPRDALPAGAPLPPSDLPDAWVDVPISLMWRPDALLSGTARASAIKASKESGSASGKHRDRDRDRDSAEAAPWAKAEAPPLMLSGYGSYGISSDPYFSVASLAYADRGIVVGTAHVRGGGEMGRYWYEEQGRLL